HMHMAQDLGRMRSLAPASALVLVLLQSAAFADLKSADDKQLHGDYPGALKDYKGVKGKDGPRATVKMGRLMLRTGDMAGAERAAKAVQKSADKAVAADAGVLLAQVYRATGRTNEAKTLLEDLVKKEPKHLAARYELILTDKALGQPDAAAKLIDGFYDDWDAAAIDQNSGTQLMYVALAARQRGDTEAY